MCSSAHLVMGLSGMLANDIHRLIMIFMIVRQPTDTLSIKPHCMGGVCKVIRHTHVHVGTCDIKLALATSAHFSACRIL